jgi:hypothetical protein
MTPFYWILPRRANGFRPERHPELKAGLPAELQLGLLNLAQTQSNTPHGPCTLPNRKRRDD